MADRPLLIFPEPTAVSRQKRSGANIPGPRRPTVGEQSERIGPKFDRLQEVFDPDRSTVQNRPDGLEPEKALVLEIEGAITDFQNAVKRIEGLEWLADWDHDLQPDDRFFKRSKEGDALDDRIRARLYVTMTDRRGAEELVSLWNRFREADGEIKFETGLNRFRDLFRQLYDLRFWDVRDRLEETGLREEWRERLEEGEEIIRAEVELWHRKDPGRRALAESRIRRFVREAGGRVLSRCEIEAIEYHALLVELPIESFESIFESMDAKLIRSDEVMFLRPRGQVVVDPVEDEDLELLVADDHPPPGDELAAVEPRVGLLDGLPLENHSLLRERLLIDDPDDWGADYSAGERRHGTAMASLIVHGDLKEEETPLRRPVYARPVLRPETYWRGSTEAMPSEMLAIDLVHRAVRRIFEGEGDEPPVAESLVAICLSLGDQTRPFLRTMSPWARLIDHLSHEYQVLFLVSAGNYGFLEVASDFDDAAQGEAIERQVLQAVAQQKRLRRLLSPAESINSLTIGALHLDATEADTPGYAFDPQPSGQTLPAYYSALGPGFRRAVKPDVTLPGGRQLVERFPGVQPSEIRPRGTTRPPGHRVAYPPKAQMSFSTTAHTRGTSNASALATRSVGLLVAELEDSTDSPFAGLPRETLALLTKTLIAHGTSQGEMHDVLQSRLSDLLALNRRSAAQYLGYGALDLSRVLRCTDERATMIGFGELKKDRGHRFRVPLPPSLAGRREWRRLTVTLAWWTPIQSSHQKYRKAALWFEPYGEQVAQPRIDSEGRTKSKNVPMDDFDAKTRLQVKRKQFDHQQVRNGTVQHEIFEGEKASAFLDGDEVHLQVNCRVEAGRLLGPAPYALAVTLEVAEGVGIPIYEEIRARLPVPVRVTA